MVDLSILEYGAQLLFNGTPVVVLDKHTREPKRRVFDGSTSCWVVNEIHDGSFKRPSPVEKMLHTWPQVRNPAL